MLGSPWRTSYLEQQYHVEATAVTPDYPSVSDFDRVFLSLSSRSQWSSMLHRTVSSIQVRKQISDRRISRLSFPLAVPYSRCPASFPGPCHSRITALGPAFRVLEYYRVRHGAEASASSTFSSLSYPSPLSPLVYHGLLYVDAASSLILDKNFRSSHTKVPWSNPNVRVRPLHSPPVRVF